MTLIDQDQRDGIMKDTSDVVVSASAGSGKTTIMTKKMAKVIESIQDHKTVAAITFTVKAYQEIRNKARKQVDKRQTFVTKTNDSFIEYEVIRPFIKDALGKEYSQGYTVEYGREYKFNTYKEGLSQLKMDNVLGSYWDNDKNFNFKLALKILETSKAAQEYIKAKYYMIFIDEYQDSDKDMHNFFMWIKRNLKIKMFIVGDSKQAIYLWRGAMRNVFELLEQESFNTYKLIKNFRCDKDIENYANLIHNPKYYLKDNKAVKNMVIQEYSFTDFNEFPKYFTNLVKYGEISLEKEITIIANVNADAKNIAESLKNTGYDFIFVPKTPIDEGIPNSNLLRELAMYTKNESYSIYDLISNTQIDERTQTRKEVQKIIKVLKNKQIKDSEFIEIVSRLSEYLEIDISDDEIEKFITSITNDYYDMAFKILESKHKVMTVFASKGLEFDQVISFSHYYELHRDRSVENHYVCITRAKEKFIMFNDNNQYYNYVVNKANEIGATDFNRIAKYLNPYS